MIVPFRDEDTDRVHGVEQSIDAVGVEMPDESQSPLVRPALDLVQQTSALRGERDDALAAIVGRDRPPDQFGVLERSQHTAGVRHVEAEFIGDLVHRRPLQRPDRVQQARLDEGDVESLVAIIERSDRLLRAMDTIGVLITEQDSHDQHDSALPT